MIRRFALLAFGSLVCLQAFSTKGTAETEPVRLLTSNGVRPVIQKLTGPAQAAIGHPLAPQFNTTAVLRQKIDSGETFDVAILTADAIDNLIRAAKLVSASRVEIGNVGIGVGIRSGAKKPAIEAPDAMKQTLLAAKAITYASDGASRPHIEKMLAELGIAETVKSKTLLLQGSDACLEAVASGKAELIMTLVTEIKQAPGVDLAGPLPAKFQNYVRFAGALSANSKNSSAGRALLQFLTDAKVASAFTAAGFTRNSAK